MCTRTKPYNLIKKLKNRCLERAPSNHQYVYHIIWTLLLQLYPSCTSNSKVRTVFFLFHSFLLSFHKRASNYMLGRATWGKLPEFIFENFKTE